MITTRLIYNAAIISSYAGDVPQFIYKYSRLFHKTHKVYIFASPFVSIGICTYVLRYTYARDAKFEPKSYIGAVFSYMW